GAGGTGGINTGFSDVNSNTSSNTGTAPHNNLTGTYYVSPDSRMTVNFDGLVYQCGLISFNATINRYQKAHCLFYDSPTATTIHGIADAFFQGTNAAPAFFSADLNANYVIEGDGASQNESIRLGEAGRLVIQGFSNAQTGLINGGLAVLNLGGTRA